MCSSDLARLIREQYDFDTRMGVVKSDSGWRPEMWAQLAELGLFMAPFSEEDGGLGGGPIDAMVVMEEFGKGLVVEPFIPSVVCGGGFLKHAGSAAQKEEHLQAIMGGASTFAFAYAEPRGRYNLADLETTAKKDGAGYVLNGHKAVVVGAPWADKLIVTARTGGDRRDTGGISVFIVDKGADGVTTRDYPTVDGRRASEVHLENVAVGADSLIGGEGDALSLIEQVVDEATAAACAEAVGAMGVAHQMTVEYSRQRKQFGTPIGKFQVLQHRMVDMFMEHEQSISMTYMATLKLGEDAVEQKKAVSAAKVRIGQSGRFVGQGSIQIHGGKGLTPDLPLAELFNYARQIRLADGPDQVHMMALGRQLVREHDGHRISTAG